MMTKPKILMVTKLVGSTVLTIGMMTSLFGLWITGSSTVTSIGIGIVMGAVFIFLMGVFFVATEEMLEKSYKGVKVTQHKGAKVVPISRKTKKGTPLHYKRSS